MTPITTHVLDLSTGRPASGLAVSLAILADLDRWEDLGRGVTDGDGRIVDLPPVGHALVVGTYRLRFETLAYFQGRGVDAFHPRVDVHFRVDDPSAHYHVPLLLSPFGYSTYRGT